MATTLEQIRFDIERAVKSSVEDAEVINWSNDAQIELISTVELPATTSIAVTTSALSYALSIDVKRVNRLWLQSERDAGVDRDIPKAYRIYNGSIIFESLFGQADTLNIEYYKHLKYFTAITDAIDVEDRFKSLYTSYGIAQYYDNPHTIERIGENQANRQYEKHYGRHLTIRDQIAAQYVMQSQPSTIKEAW